MSRKQVLYQIDKLLTGCAVCPKRAEMNREMKGLFARMDGHCNKNCEVGSKLQQLGKSLVRT
jgi:hypothetical protein